MKVSLIIPTFNRGYLLNKTLTRIKSFDYVPDEIIVVDDGSQDCTKEIAKAHDVRYIYLNAPYFRGCSIPKNVGIRNATHDVVIFSEPELFWVTPVAQQMVNYLEENPNQFYSVGTVYKFNSEIPIDNPLQSLETYRIYDHREFGHDLEFQIMQMTGWQALWSWGILKEHLYAVGGYDEEMATSWGFDDIDISTRLRCNRVHQRIQTDMKAIHMYHDKVPSHLRDSWAINEQIFLDKNTDVNPETIVSNRGKEWGVIA